MAFFLMLLDGVPLISSHFYIFVFVSSLFCNPIARASCIGLEDKTLQDCHAAETSMLQQSHLQEEKVKKIVSR